MSQATQKQRKLNKFWFVWNLIESLILFGGGVMSIVAGVMAGQGSGGSAPQGIENGIAYAVAAFIILDGVLRIVLHLARLQKDTEQSPMVIAGFEVSLGILLVLLQSRFTNEHIFTFTVVNLIAIILMVMGVLLLVYAIYAIAKKFAKLFMPVVEILFAAILAGVGVVIEVLYHTESSKDQLVLIMTGSILCLAAIGMFIITLVTRAKAKKELDQAEREEQGDYDVDDGNGKRRSAAPSQEPKPAEIIDVIDEEQPHVEQPQQIKGEDAKKLGGPRALDQKPDQE